MPGCGLACAAWIAAASPSCASARPAPVGRELRATAPAQQQQEPDPDANYRTEFFAADGIYLSARSHWSHLGGDFDGNTALVGPDTIFIPEADDGSGYELALGWMSQGWAMELTYTRLGYDGSIGASSADIEYQAVSWNGMRYLRANEPLQPYWLFGLSFPWMDLDDASSAGAAVGNAELRNGFGFSGGLGLAWRLGAHLALDVRSVYTYQFFEEAEGVSDDSETIDDGIDGPTFGVSVGLTWILGKIGGGDS